MICLLLFFALKNILVLLAKCDSGELRCPATALILSAVNPFNPKETVLCWYLSVSAQIYLVFIWATSYQNQQNDLCTQRSFRSAWASAQSDQSSLCTLRIASKDQGFFMWTAKTLIRLGGQVYLLVCHAAAHLSYGITSKSAIMSWNKSPLMEWICKLLGYVTLCYCKYSNVKFTNGGIMT